MGSGLVSETGNGLDNSFRLTLGDIVKKASSHPFGGAK